MNRSPTITVLAGVNGAGKSSVAGEFAETERDFFFNPDTVAQKLLGLHPNLTLPLANGHAWSLGKNLLEDAIARRIDYRFETTLGGNTIPRLLMEAASAGHELHIWFCGLASAELHLTRVQSRVAQGGHDIPEGKIRERWARSRENLIKLLPFIHHLRVYDNSEEADIGRGQSPQPKLVLEMKEQQVTAPNDLTDTPDWAKPIVAAGLRLMQET
jgi:predicted ABC-type ATPase